MSNNYYCCTIILNLIIQPIKLIVTVVNVMIYDSFRPEDSSKHG